MPLRVRSLRFRYAGSRIDSLGGVDLDVAPGEICRILGPHGSGKSTLLHCVAGIAPEMRAGEREGSIALAGSDLTRGRLAPQRLHPLSLLAGLFLLTAASLLARTPQALLVCVGAPLGAGAPDLAVGAALIALAGLAMMWK
jgi:ABC-type cobalamin/Fe3+-siderophores transport system ATPase subunit